MAFVQQMSGALGKQTLQQSCMLCLPSVERATTVSDCQKKLVEITKSELWQFVEQSAHGEVEKVKKWVDSLERGFPPKVPAEHSSAFLLQAWRALGYFARESKRLKVKVSEDKTETKDVPIFGAEALEMKFKLVKKKGDTVTSDDIKLLVSTRHLLDDATNSELNTMSAKVSEKLAGKRPAGAAATHVSDLKPKKAKTDAAQEAEAAADDVFS
eukprot:6461886-Amphidinium_carterae.1